MVAKKGDSHSERLRTNSTVYAGKVTAWKTKSKLFHLYLSLQQHLCPLNMKFWLTMLISTSVFPYHLLQAVLPRHNQAFLTFILALILCVFCYQAVLVHHSRPKFPIGKKTYPFSKSSYFSLCVISIQLSALK